RSALVSAAAMGLLSVPDSARRSHAIDRNGASTLPSKRSMGKTILVVGFGPGISSAVAEKFGSAGFSVALVARNQERLAAGVSALKAQGVDAAAFLADAGDPAAI